MTALDQTAPTAVVTVDRFSGYGLHQILTHPHASSRTTTRTSSSSRWPSSTRAPSRGVSEVGRLEARHAREPREVRRPGAARRAGTLGTGWRVATEAVEEVVRICKDLRERVPAVGRLQRQARVQEGAAGTTASSTTRPPWRSSAASSSRASRRSSFRCARRSDAPEVALADGLGDEPVADPRLRDDVAGPRGVGLDLLAQRADVDPDGVGRRARRAVPDAADDLPDRDGLARVRREELEDRELGRREPDLLALDDDAAPLAIQREPGELEDLLAALRPRAGGAGPARGRGAPGTENGLTTKSSAPRSSARILSASPPRTERTRIGVLPVAAERAR